MLYIIVWVSVATIAYLSRTSRGDVEFDAKYESFRRKNIDDKFGSS